MMVVVHTVIMKLNWMNNMTSYYAELQKKFLNFIVNYDNELYLFEDVGIVDSINSYYLTLWFDYHNINIDLWFDNDESDCTFTLQIARDDIKNELKVNQLLAIIMIEIQKDIAFRREVIKKKYEEDIADLLVNENLIARLLDN